MMCKAHKSFRISYWNDNFLEMFLVHGLAVLKTWNVRLELRSIVIRIVKEERRVVNATSKRWSRSKGWNQLSSPEQIPKTNPFRVGNTWTNLAINLGVGIVKSQQLLSWAARWRHWKRKITPLQHPIRSKRLCSHDFPTLECTTLSVSHSCLHLIVSSLLSNLFGVA